MASCHSPIIAGILEDYSGRYVLRGRATGDASCHLYDHLGLGVALLLNQHIPGRTFFRVAYYLPVITSWVIVSLLFEYMFNGQAGLVNYILKDFLHIIPKDILWFADEYLTLVPIILLDIWKGIGWAAIIFLAGLQAIPAELYEAARVDGADSTGSTRSSR